MMSLKRWIYVLVLLLRQKNLLAQKSQLSKYGRIFGEEIGVLQTSAQVTVHYTPESLIGRSIIGCVNLGEKNIAGFTSQFLLVGFSDSDGAICLITVDPKVPNGQKLH